MIYLLDANVLVHLANRVQGAERIEQRLISEPRARVRLSAATAHELRYMIVRAKASRAHVAALDALVRQFRVEPFDLPAAHAAADVRAHLEERGRPIGIFDMLLSGHARRLAATVVSDDGDFDRVPGLARENWLR